MINCNSTHKRKGHSWL